MTAGAITAAVAGLVALVASMAAPSLPSPVEQFAGGQTVAFYGDSYTLGTGASDPSLRWSTTVSVERGWNEVNPSVNGLGFVNNRQGAPGTGVVQQVIDSKPDIVFVTMGLNDNFSMPARSAEIKSAITEDFTTLKAELPQARFIVVEPFWYTDDRPESVDTIIGWVKDAAAVIDADYIPGASNWIEGHPEWMASDGLHPNDAGYRALAERMDTELATLGL
ncbi:G-D-S-L family lipolytic protein [Cryobacterium roopkundense]|uniref:G-D-S-L family lipolytic protein n=1 Tax=Cryobacterium roopkundense TaxID=1001240 RepID=A0A099JR28_9MICO|nr:G-D-S-L family lipolytic protein [Cryobacterium roopkundense]